LKDLGVEGEKLGFFAKLVKDEKQLNDTFKDIVEIIWDYLQDNRRKVYRGKDFKPNHGKAVPESYEDDLTRFDLLLERFYNDEYDEETEYEYDMKILSEEKNVLSFENYLVDRW
jgi:hypothetical protein